MAIQKIKTFTNIGLQGYEIVIEADANRSLPTIDIIGLPDAAIKEQIPAHKIILNLAPSDIRKEGTRFDVPMAVALLMPCRDGETTYPDQVRNALFF